MKRFATSLLLLLLFASSIQAQDSKKYYNPCAGQNAIYKDYKNYSLDDASVLANKKKGEADPQAAAKISRDAAEEKLRQANAEKIVVEEVSTTTGVVTKKVITREKVNTDSYGNAVGNNYDLAVDGAFKGNTVAVLQLYSGNRHNAGFDFEDPKKALAEKGFSVYRWIDNPPSPKELREKLKMACQLWIISDDTRKLNDEHLAVIKEFFESGKGLYIWGDNAPYYADANFVGAALLDITMEDHSHSGQQVVGLKKEDNTSGILQNHLITTGMNYVYEGHTIATVNDNTHLTPLIWGSGGNVVTAVYEQDGKRAIFDGGFTRLYLAWDTAGTGRYVKNAAAWLTNIENVK